jgi:HEAT repeat protein
MIQKLFHSAFVGMLLFSTAVFAQEQETERPQRKYLYPTCAMLSSDKPEIARQIEQLQDKDVTVREKMARQLGSSCDQRAVAPLITLLSDADAKVRVAAVESLAKLNDRSAGPPMIEMAELKEKDWSVRAVLGQALATFQYYAAGYAALNAVANPGADPVRSVDEIKARCNAILAVNEMTDVRFSRKATLFLFRFRSEITDPELKKIVDETLMKLGETRNGIHELRGIFKQDRFPENRVNAAYWLGQIGAESARGLLTEASIGDSNAKVRQTAKEALALLDKKQATETKQ